MADSQAAEHYVSITRCQDAEARRLQTDIRGLGAWRRTMARLTMSCLRTLFKLVRHLAFRVFYPTRTITTLSALLPFCEDANVVCFDVFDTLLYRNVEPPDFLKRRPANYAAQLLCRRGYPLTRDLFLYVRNEAETRLRRRAQRSRADSECKLSDIIHEALKSLLGTKVADEATEALVCYELEVECHHLRLAPDVRELLQTIRSRGKRVIVASDTYLEKRHLDRIFAHLGIDQYIDAIYASSEYGLGKHSGRLFHKILESESVEPSKLLHVGDNFESDVLRPTQAGMTAVFLRNAARLSRRQRLARLTQRALSGNDAAPLFTTRPEPLPASYAHLGSDDREVFLIGRDILGPAFCLFILQVVEECHRRGVADIYYLAREGLLFRKIHDILTENIHRFRRLPAIPHHYLYISRMATSLPSIRDLGHRELALARFRHSSSDPAGCLQTFGLDPSDFADLLGDLPGESQTATQRLFSDPRFVENVHARARLERSRLRKYLAQEQFFGQSKTTALVDIGWHATIQANLTRAFHDDPDFPILIGLYFGRRYNHDDDYWLSPRSIFTPGLFFDEHRDIASEHAIRHCLEIFEIAACAPHGTTVGYEETGNGAQPVLAHSPSGLIREQELLQVGVLEHAVSFSKSYNDHELDVSLLQKQTVRRLATFLLKPTLRQVRALSRLAHSADWGSDEIRPLIATNLTPLSIFNPVRFLNSVLRSCWLEGSLRLSRIPGGLLLLALAWRALPVRRFLSAGIASLADSFRNRPTER